MSDNGKIEGQDKPVEKTEAQLKEERLARYNTDPDSFIEISELICAAIRNPKSQLGISVLVGNCKRSELNNAQVELEHRMSLVRRSMDIESEMKKEAVKNLIVPGAHNMINGARKIFGRSRYA